MNIAASEYKIGQELYREDRKIKWRVVRIVEKDTAVVADDSGQEVISIETYVMLKSEQGDIDFVVLLHEEAPSPTTEKRIPALPNLWRKKSV